MSLATHHQEPPCTLWPWPDDRLEAGEACMGQGGGRAAATSSPRGQAGVALARREMAVHRQKQTPAAHPLAGTHGAVEGGAGRSV